MGIRDTAPPSPIPASSERVRTNERIPAEDGVELIADLYIPGGEPPFPAVVEITPYCAQAAAKLGEIYATRGYLFLAVDARGRYRSGGDWEPMAHDQSDGHAVLEWISRHRLCNGRVGTRGHSYCGYNQLLCAVDAPPALQAMVVCVAPGDPFQNVPFQGGAYDINDLMWLLTMTGRSSAEDCNVEDFGIKRFGAEDLESNPYEQATPNGEDPQREAARMEALCAQADAALAAQPFCEMDLRFGVRHEIFREWVAHWRLDFYWEARSAIARADRTAVPTLHISGWWDLNGRGATHAYRAMRAGARTSGARENQRLLMGPWTHGLNAPDCSALPREEALLIERAALRDELNDEFAWFDHHLKDIEPGPSTAARTTLFVTGLCRWVEFDDWPPAATEMHEYFLRGARTPGAGVLGGEAPRNGPFESSYRFDPGDPTPFAAAGMLGEKAPFDNSVVEASRRDMCLFDTPALQAPLALVGEPYAVLYARADAPDFDLCVKLLDVYPDGRAIYLTDGVIRARFRAGWKRPEPVVPGQIHPFRIDLWHVAHVLRLGHALRLEVASSAFRRFDVNPCTGGDLATETDHRTVNVSVVHCADFPSRLCLPVCRDARLEPGPTL